MRWMATAGGVSMDEIILSQGFQLREQIAASAKSRVVSQ